LLPTEKACSLFLYYYNNVIFEAWSLFEQP